MVREMYSNWIISDNVITIISRKSNLLNENEDLYKY